VAEEEDLREMLVQGLRLRGQAAGLRGEMET
jgi:hypothetical protein